MSWLWFRACIEEILRCVCSNLSIEQYYILFIHNSSECPKNVIPAPPVSPQGRFSLFSVSIALCSGSTRFIIHYLAHTLDFSIDLMLPPVWFLKQSMINLWQLLPEWPEGKKHRMDYLSWCMALRWIRCFWTWVSDQTWEYNNESIKNPFCLSLSFSQCFYMNDYWTLLKASQDIFNWTWRIMSILLLLIIVTFKWRNIV